MRSAIALDPRLFGRGRSFILSLSQAPARPILSDDLKLFATTFLGGFLFVAIFVA